MTKINFDYNLKKDAWSWVLIAKDKNTWGLNWRQQVAHIPDDLLQKIETTSFARAQLRKKLKNIWLKNKDFKNLVDEAIGIIEG